MAVVMDDNFDGAPGDPFLGDQHFTVFGPVGLVPSHYGVAVRFPAGTAAFLTQATFPATTGPRVFSRIYRRAANPTATAQTFQVRSASGAICTASIRTNGAMGLHNSGSTGTNLAITPGPLPTGTEFRVVYTVNGTSFNARVFADLAATTPLYDVTATITAGTMAATREGNPNGIGLAGTTLDLAWPVDDNVTDPGPRRYVYLAADTAVGVVPRTVNVQVHTENVPEPTYSVAWGDGATTGPQASPSFARTFTTPGEYAMTPTAGPVTGKPVTFAAPRAWLMRATATGMVPVRVAVATGDGTVETLTPA